MSKYKAGDWVTDTMCEYHIKDVEEDDYVFDDVIYLQENLVHYSFYRNGTFQLPIHTIDKDTELLEGYNRYRKLRGLYE